MRTPFLISSVLVSTATFFAVTSPAFAYNITGAGINNINSNDIGDVFRVNFDGSVEETSVDGLSGSAYFTLNSFGVEDVSGTDYTIAEFDVNLTNTSTAPISSRISRMGFDSDPNIIQSASSVNGVFNTVDDGRFPNQVGDVEVCLYDDKGNCTGGPGGVETGDTGNFTLKLAFADTSLDSFNLDNFHLRYQSIDGTPLGTSGTGDGFVMADSVDAPEPLTLLGTGIAAGFGAIFRKEQQKKRNQKEKVKV
ncbi:MAG: cistern family PEP-CTERM protein [Cyanobacteriota bacterium]|nr:cistern family PEP-CTERM protein [Cyanobacteriota bacterium]